MKDTGLDYLSTAGQAPPVGLGEAVRRGLAPDGGLYLPERVPRLDEATWRRLLSGKETLPALAAALLAPYVAGVLRGDELRRLTRDTFSFPIPLVALGDETFVLELFHGPTLAFKDVGARFLARLLPLVAPPGDEPVTVLVATSGDTGGAVAQAFHGVGGTRVVVLYPRGQVSPRQERQFATLGGNVRALAVEGTFDDCQRLVKQAFADPNLARRHRLTSANSINLGRLLPQMVYYVHGAAQLPAHGFDPLDPERSPVMVVPSGNFGNLTAGLLAHLMGLPCHRFVAATNANRVVPDYLASGRFEPRPSLPTLANAMDVGDPSNFARIRALAGEDLSRMRLWMWSESISDAEIRETIAAVHRRTGHVPDPHTAVAHLALERYRRQEPDEAAGRPAVILATAHPAKFSEVVEPVLGTTLPLPDALSACLERPLLAEPIEAELGALAAKLAAADGDPGESVFAKNV